MRGKNHEKYFALLEGGATPLTAASPLEEAIKKTWGAVDAFLVR